MGAPAALIRRNSPARLQKPPSPRSSPRVSAHRLLRGVDRKIPSPATVSAGKQDVGGRGGPGGAPVQRARQLSIRGLRREGSPGRIRWGMSGRIGSAAPPPDGPATLRLLMVPLPPCSGDTRPLGSITWYAHQGACAVQDLPGLPVLLPLTPQGDRRRRQTGRWWSPVDRPPPPGPLSGASIPEARDRSRRGGSAPGYALPHDDPRSRRAGHGGRAAGARPPQRGAKAVTTRRRFPPPEAGHLAFQGNHRPGVGSPIRRPRNPRLREPRNPVGMVEGHPARLRGR